MTAPRRAVAVAGALLLAAGLSTTTAPAAQASPIGDCTSDTGTVVAVDYSHWNGPIVRGCDLSKPPSGIRLLTDTGFRTTGTQHDGPQFLCRIGNQAFDDGTQYPTPKDEPCVKTPPASAYWSYWLAPKGQNSWSYSQFGAYSDKPSEGEVELWIFGGTDITGSNGDPVNGFPVCTPDSLRAGGSAKTCTPTGTKAGRGVDHYAPRSAAKRRKAGSKATAGSRPRTGARTASGHPATSAAPSASIHVPTTHAPAATATSPTARAGTPAPASSSQAAGNIVEAKPASSGRPSAGPATGLIVGVLLAAVLAGAAVWTVLRRRRLEG